MFKWIGLLTNNYPKDRDKIAKALGMEDIIGDPRYLNYETLKESGVIPAAVKRCNKIFIQKTSAQWQDYLTSHDVACSIVHNTKDIVTDEQALANGFIKKVQFKDGLEVALPTPPIKFSEYGCKDTVVTGNIGEHTDEILTKFGYSDSEINDLRQEHIII